uniref:Uncharacterized protein n=1 Tax=Mus spicilegus TaxID=10103 RepID=A0A8C6H0I6_MUSSI
MVLSCSLWLLSVCLLSWCCDAQNPELSDLESKSDPIPLVIWNTIVATKFKTLMEKTVPGVYILQLEIGKQMMKDLENQALDATSQVCQILAQDPRLQDGYISVTFSKGIRFL